MSNWRNFRTEIIRPTSSLTVLLAIFGLTLSVDFTVGIGVAAALTTLLFIKRLAEADQMSTGTDEVEEEGDPYATDPNAIRRRPVPGGVDVYEVEGVLFFGAAIAYEERVESDLGHPKVLILRMRKVQVIDSTALRALKAIIQRSRQVGTLVLLSDVHARPLVALRKSTLIEEIGEKNIFGNVDDALNRARTHLGLSTSPPPEGATPTVARERADPIQIVRG